MDSNRLYTQAIDKFGEPSQIEMLIEELAELQLALQKFKRSPSKERAFEVCDEMADVEIMLEQNKLIFSDSVITERKQFKLERLKDTLQDTLYNKYQMDPEELKQAKR